MIHGSQFLISELVSYFRETLKFLSKVLFRIAKQTEPGPSLNSSCLTKILETDEESGGSPLFFSLLSYPHKWNLKRFGDASRGLRQGDHIPHYFLLLLNV